MKLFKSMNGSLHVYQSVSWNEQDLIDLSMIESTADINEEI